MTSTVNNAVKELGIQKTRTALQNLKSHFEGDARKLARVDFMDEIVKNEIELWLTFMKGSLQNRLKEAAKSAGEVDLREIDDKLADIRKSMTKAEVQAYDDELFAISTYLNTLNHLRKVAVAEEAPKKIVRERRPSLDKNYDIFNKVFQALAALPKKAAPPKKASASKPKASESAQPLITPPTGPRRSSRNKKVN
jgi:hypothetical protein